MGWLSEPPRWEACWGESHHPCCLLSTVLLEKKAEAGLQETILGVQLQVPGVVELHLEGLLGQYGPMGSRTLKMKYSLLGTVLG